MDKVPLSRKGIAQMISYVLVIAISVAAMSLVLLWGRPVLDRAFESATVNEALNNMNILSNAIREVASEGAGSLRTVRLNVGGGSYRADNASSAVHFGLKLGAGSLFPGTSARRGDIQISVSGVSGDAELKLTLNYTSIIVVGDGNGIGRGMNKICIENMGTQNNTPVVSVRRC